MNINRIDQMELSLNGKASRRARPGRPHRRQRAQWWFARMRQVVDTAMEWRPAPPARPEQVYMTLSIERLQAHERAH
ncbi:MAG TPA: hypothetical protein VH619_18875 [Verrucomicrobiae bacterium]|nr:hypothetical protein [Verrucomicrobiae bacterium]